MFARFNATVAVALLVGSLSVAAAIFLILELSRPYAGLIQLSDEPLRNVLALPPAAEALFDALRAERSRLAKQQGVPPYVIFHDTTLRAMATVKPRTLDYLELLPGMGARKLERYGVVFLGIIRTAL